MVQECITLHFGMLLGMENLGWITLQMVLYSQKTLPESLVANKMPWQPSLMPSHPSLRLLVHCLNWSTGKTISSTTPFFISWQTIPQPSQSRPQIETAFLVWQSSQTYAAAHTGIKMTYWMAGWLMWHLEILKGGNFKFHRLDGNLSFAQEMLSS